MDNYYNGMNMQYNLGNAPNYILWLILGIIQICSVCCCGIPTMVCGIVTVIFAVTANQQFQQGNAVLYIKKMRAAKIWNIIGWVLLVLSFILNWTLLAFVGRLD